MPAVEHIGRMRYAAPEIIAEVGPRQHRQLRPTVSEAADIWAFGMVAYELLTQERIFPQGATEADVRKAAFLPQAAGGGYPWEEGISGSDARNVKLKALTRIVLQCLMRDQDDRPSTEMLSSQWQKMRAHEQLL
jgi:serine/threonine protein kinase